ncbi:DUF721 domain-containing protein [Bifidobacterium leontopitheci]|uniref:DUF721 domain-containing protein n=1 Tax=Bifidobacterium leontopitheci TaxID=2650774 RepID=A0A6I1GFH1_9BIFI|nr:DUF721 domain-containing protein [Bifidobacterium leontopitheci]KAB7790364.1 hypothetical protein F7D09_1120 [Bifidobacterium leontopitheci]
MREPVTVTLHLDERKLPAEVFESIAKRAGIRRERRLQAEAAWESFGKPGRDPAKLGSVAGLLAREDHWTPYLKIAQLRTHWDQVVGAAVAQHSQVMGVIDGVMTIRADSAAWATQLTYLVPQFERTIKERLDGLDIQEIRVVGPRPESKRGLYRRGRRGRR